jgi:iron complex outermembrane recepter protein
MRKGGKLPTLLSSLVCIGGISATSGLVHAQVSGQSKPGVVENDSTSLAEVVVTASKRSESLQNVSAAVTAIGGDRLASEGINNVEDLQRLVPSLTVGQAYNQAKITIRGVGVNDILPGTDAAVALYEDQAYISNTVAQLTAMFDLERIEILRGPQGSLYGRNAVGGAINLITAKPTDDLEGYSRLTIGNYDLEEFEGAISGPINSWLKMRLATKIDSRGGYGEDITTGNPVDNSHKSMFRVQADITPADRFDWLISGEYYDQNDASGAFHNGGDAFPNFVPIGAGGFASNPRDTAGDFDPFTRTRTWSVTSTGKWEANDWLTVTNITNYRWFDSTQGQDMDMSSVYNSEQTTGADSTLVRDYGSKPQLSTELQFGTNSQFVKGTTGFNYFYEKLETTTLFGGHPDLGPDSSVNVIAASGYNPLALLATCGISNLAYSPARSDGQVNPAPDFCGAANGETKAVGIYSQYEINLGFLTASLSSVSLKLGGRYSNESRSASNPSVAVTTTDVFVAPSSWSVHYHNISPTAGAEWKPTEDTLLYYTYSQGFKAGGGDLQPGDTNVVKPERIVNNEFGFKGTFFDRRLLLDAAGFYYTLENLQIERFIGSPTGIGFVDVFENAALAKAHGAELEASVLPVQGVRLDASVAYLHSVFTQYVTSDPLSPAAVVNGQVIGAGPPESLAGNPTPHSPTWSGDLRGEVDLPSGLLPGNGLYTFGADIGVKSRDYLSEFHRNDESMSGYATVGTTLAWHPKDSGLSVELWGRNLTNKLIINNFYALNTIGLKAVTYEAPRTYGATIGYKF